MNKQQILLYFWKLYDDKGSDEAMSWFHNNKNYYYNAPYVTDVTDVTNVTNVTDTYYITEDHFSSLDIYINWLKDIRESNNYKNDHIINDPTLNDILSNLSLE